MVCMILYQVFFVLEGIMESGDPILIAKYENVSFFTKAGSLYQERRQEGEVHVSGDTHTHIHTQTPTHTITQSHTYSHTHSLIGTVHCT